MSRGAGASLTRVLLKGLVLIATLLAGAWLVEATGLSIDEAWVDSRIRGKGPEGELLFVAMGTAAAALGVPRQLVAFSGGYAFGIVEGTLWSLLAMVSSCVVDFFYARLIARGFVQARFGRRIARFDAVLRGHPFSTTLLIRLLPAGNNVLTNLLAGVSTAPALPFFAGSAVGYVPQAVIFALLGSGIKVDPELRISASVVLFVAAALLGVYLFRRIRRNRRVEEEMAAIMAPDDQPEAEAERSACIGRRPSL